MNLRFPLTTDLLAVISIWIKYLRSILKETCGLTIPQFRVLSCLEQNRTMCLNDIASSLQLSPSTTNYIVNHLSTNGLLVKRQDHYDRRLAEIFILPEGLKLTRHAHKILMAAEIHFTQPLGSFLKDLISQCIEVYEDNYLFVSQNPNYLVDRSVLNALVLYEKKMVDLLNQFEVNNNEFRILFELHERSNKTTIGNLARALLLKTSDTTVACSKLEEEKLVLKNKSSFDKRTSLVDITNKGLNLLWQTAAKIDDMLFNASGEDSLFNREMMIKATHVLAKNQRMSFVCG